MGVERGDLVTLCQGRIVENGFQEIVQAAPHRVDALADMDQFRRAGTDGMDPENAPVVTVDVQLQKPGIVAENMAVLR